VTRSVIAKNKKKTVQRLFIENERKIKHFKNKFFILFIMNVKKVVNMYVMNEFH